MKVLWYLLTLFFGLVGVLAAIRLIERLAAVAGFIVCSTLDCVGHAAAGMVVLTKGARE